MSGRHQPENGADSLLSLYQAAKEAGLSDRDIAEALGVVAETATAAKSLDDDRLHSAGVAPDGVAPQTVAHTTSAGGTSADNEPARRVRQHLAILRGRAVRQWMDGPAQYDVNEIDAALNAFDAALAAERASGGLDVERLAEALYESGVRQTMSQAEESARNVAAEYARLASDLRPQADPHGDAEAAAEDAKWG